MPAPTDPGSPRGEDAALTIVIVSYRCRALLASCLRSLCADGLDGRARIVVVDNDSRDGTPEMVESCFPSVEVRRAGGNLGFSSANNLVLREARSDFVLLLNPDTVVPPGAVERALEAIEQRPDVGMLGCKLVKEDGSLDHACRRTLPDVRSSLRYFSGVDRARRGSASGQGYAGTTATADASGPVEAINGAFMLVRRAAMLEVGLLDERFWMYGEDLDWCLRFAEAGWGIYYFPEVSVTHVKGATAGGVRSRRANLAFHEAMWLYYAKHQSLTHPPPLRAAVALGVAAKFALTEARIAGRRRAAGVVPASEGIGRPLSVLVVATDQRLAAGLRARHGQRLSTTFVQVGSGWISMLSMLEATRAEQPDLVVVDRGLRPRALSLLRAFGWRAVVGDPSDLEGQSTAELCRAAARPGAGLDAGPAVSVVATVLNERNDTGELVRKLGAQMREGDELIVADGGSVDGTRELLKELATVHAGLRVVDAPGTNISGGRNAAIRVAANQVIATTDAGCHTSAGWLDALRMPFSEPHDMPGLAAGVPEVRSLTPLQEAQRAACYPDPIEVRRPTLFVRLYTRLFGTAFDPAEPFARFLAFTRESWEEAGGFPEDLGWTEDGIFGRAISRQHACDLVTDGKVIWDQRASLRSTFHMYENYGRGAAQSADPALLARDGIRAVAYLVAGLSAIGPSSLRRAVVLGGMGYLSLPLVRARRQGAGLAGSALIPVALVTKDLGKVSGELRALVSRRSSKR